MFVENRFEDNRPSMSSGRELLRKNILWLNGKSVPLLSGEVQFFRMSPDVWETCLQGVKELGLPMVSTYLSWRRFSLGPDQYDLTGRTNPRLNLPRFLSLCQKAGLWITIKPGPWICAEEMNGGYPQWLVSIPDLQVLDHQDQPVIGYNPPFQSPIPSYLHPIYQDYVRRWLEAVDNVIRPYCYPHGPIVLVQLDNEPCYTFHDRIFESDYNPSIASKDGLYEQWQSRKYAQQYESSRCCQSEQKNPTPALPPRSLEISKMQDLPQYRDWVEFKEWLFTAHIRTIHEHHVRNGISHVLFTTNYNEHPQLATPNNWNELENASGIGGFDYYPLMPMQFKDFVKTALAVNYSLCATRVPWSPEIMCGIWSFEGQHHDPYALKPEDFEYLYLTCLAFGLKGMNFYMLADRDNWVGSPLNEVGIKTPSARVVERITGMMNGIPGFYDLEKAQSVGIIYYRPYAQEAFISNETPVTLNGYTLGEAYKRFIYVYEQLLRINCDPGLIDLSINPQSLSRYPLVILPAGPYMDREAQRLLAGYVHAGGILVVFPGVPQQDLSFSPCSLLESTGDPAVSIANHPWQMHRLGNGRWYEIPSDYPQTDEWSQVLEEAHVHPAVEASAAGVLTILHEGNGQHILFVLNPNDASIKTGLTFQDRVEGHLVDVLEPAESFPIESRKTALDLSARSVRVFFIRD